MPPQSINQLEGRIKIIEFFPKRIRRKSKMMKVEVEVIRVKVGRIGDQGDIYNDVPFVSKIPTI